MFLPFHKEERETACDFQSTFQENQPLQQGYIIKGKKIDPREANSFLLKVDPHWDGMQIIIGIVASLESASCHLEGGTCIYVL